LTWRLPTAKEVSKKGPYSLATESVKSIDIEKEEVGDLSVIN